MEKLNKYFIKSLLFITLFAFAMVSCSDDDDNDGAVDTKLNLDKTGAFILNHGKSGENNGQLTYYNISKNEIIDKLFERQNKGLRLGDLSQDILIHDSKTFITASSAHLLYVTDMNAELLKVIDFNAACKKPRYVVGHEGYVYVDFYSGHLAKVDTKTFEVVEIIEIPAYSEKMVVVGDELFITNSLYYGETTGGKSVTVVNLKNFKIERPAIDVHVNPNEIVADSKGNIYVISWGIWGGNGDEGKSALSIIKAGTYKAEVIKLDIANMLTVQHDKILLAKTVNKTTEFSQYDLSKVKEGDELSAGYSATPFVTMPNNNEVVALLDRTHAMSINPVNDDIYLTSSDYTTTGSVIIFDKAGKYKTHFLSGGINPYKVAFMQGK